MLKQGSGEKPLWSQLFDILESMIKSGEFEIGDLIPSEKELMENYDVSRITVRKALEKLSLIGLVSRERGIGTVVIKNEAVINSSFQSLFQGVKESSLERKILSAKMVKPPEKIKEFFQLEDKEKVLCLIRKAYLKGREVVYYESYLHPNMNIDHKHTDFTTSMYQILNDVGYRITSMQEHISAHISTQEEMKLFKREEVFAILYRERIAYCKEAPIEYTYSKYVDKDYELEINLI